MGLCIAKCCSDYLSASSVSEVDLKPYFRDAFGLTYSLNGFSIDQVFSIKAIELPNGKTISLEEHINHTSLSKTLAYKRSFPDSFKNLTIEEEMFITAELCRSIAAHILSAPQVYSVRNPQAPFQTAVEIPPHFLNGWVAQQHFEVNPRTTQLDELDILERDFARAIYRDIQTFSFEDTFKIIFKNLRK